MRSPVLSTMEFWQLLCDARTLRIGKLSARRGGEVYVTLEAPEDDPKLMGEVFTRTLDAMTLGKRYLNSRRA
jgi:hypothetical protein